MDKKTAGGNSKDKTVEEGDERTSGTHLRGTPKVSETSWRPDLTDAQQKLLMKFFDQECSFPEAIRARLILRNNVAAQGFLANQRKDVGDSSLSSAIQTIEDCNRKIPGGSLWSGIYLGISQEKRLRSASLGTIPREEFSELRGVWGDRIGWGVSGALVAAGVMFVAANVFDLGSARVGGATTKDFRQSALGRDLTIRGTAGLPQAREGEKDTLSLNQRRMVVLEGAKDGMPVRLVRAPRVKAPRSSAQVEWVRSNGKPTFIRDPRQGAPIIWIKRIPKVIIPSNGASIEKWRGSAEVPQVEPYADFE